MKGVALLFAAVAVLGISYVQAAPPVAVESSDETTEEELDSTDVNSNANENDNAVDVVVKNSNNIQTAAAKKSLLAKLLR